MAAVQASIPATKNRNQSPAPRKEVVNKEEAKENTSENIIETSVDKAEIQKAAAEKVTAKEVESKVSQKVSQLKGYVANAFDHGRSFVATHRRSLLAAAMATWILTLLAVVVLVFMPKINLMEVVKNARVYVVGKVDKKVALSVAAGTGVLSTIAFFAKKLYNRRNKAAETKTD
eukprot:TRINITY_DN1560_c1_g1_i1.p1 TRINITY_DN1560_c1_g1~~TRINITY_DN1560_c1_g1_i1.p1  ORF type:complete len:202 (+),score=48.36 TRINITY_DN1560_c1_g1_i1:85-606(+)